MKKILKSKQKWCSPKNTTIRTEQNPNGQLALKVGYTWANSIQVFSSVNTGQWHIEWILLGKLETQNAAKTKLA